MTISKKTKKKLDAAIRSVAKLNLDIDTIEIAQALDRLTSLARRAKVLTEDEKKYLQRENNLRTFDGKLK